MKPNPTITENIGQHDKHRGWLSRLVRLLLIRDLRNVEEDIAALEVKASAWDSIVCDKVYILDRASDYNAKLARKRKRAEWLRNILDA